MIRAKIHPNPRWCALAIAAGADCYNPDFSGLSCQQDAECGPLICIDGHCGHPAATGSDSTSPTTSTAATLTGQIPTSGDGTTTGLTSTSSSTVLPTTTGQTSSSESSDTTISQTTSSESTGTTAAPDDGPCCNEIDVLFVIDQSTSMQDQCFEDGLLAATLEIFPVIFEIFSQRVTSFHIGFTMASIVPENPTECTSIGSLVQGRPMDECVQTKLGGLPYMTSEIHGSDANVFFKGISCILGAGTPADPPADFEYSRPVEAALWALHSDLNAESACNHGFARPDAPLIVFLFTNVDQPISNGLPQGKNDPKNWWAFLSELRSGVNTRDRSALILIAGPSSEEPADGCEAEWPQRIQSFASYFDQDHVRQFDICNTRNCPPTELTAITAFLQESLQTLVCSVCESTN